MLRRIHVAYGLYAHDEDKGPGEFQEDLKLLLSDLTNAVNDAMAIQIHTINLEFRA